MTVRILSLSLSLVATVVFLAATQGSFAQTDAARDAAQPTVVVIKHSNPFYPPAARLSRIAGDVTLKLSIRKDGGVESVELVSGHPLLAQAALESARKFQFECRRCSEQVTPYLMVYTFAIGSCGAEDQLASAPDPLSGRGREHIRVVTCNENVVIVDYFHRARAAKCLYLWKCGLR